jgi:hypothetical protein
MLEGSRESRGEDGRRGHAEHQSTRGRQEKEEGNMDGQDWQDGGGEAGIGAQAEAPGVVDGDAFVELIAGTEGVVV